MTIVLGEPVDVEVVLPPTLVVSVEIPSTPTVVVLYPETITVTVEPPSTPVISIPVLPGPPGSPGTTGGSFIYTQGIPSTVWDITHDLEYTPNLLVVDSAGTIMFGEIQWLSSKHLTVSFSIPVSGFAYLS